ncbi:MAG: T9SS type A sorting domain-containing protein, partial [Flavobacteriales bacterium]
FANFRLGKLVGSPCDTIVSSISEPLNVKSVKVFPNPSNGWVQLQVPAPGPYQLSVYNTTGQRLHTQTLSAHKAHIDFNALALPSGIYLLQVQNSKTGEVMHSKVVYERN